MKLKILAPVAVFLILTGSSCLKDTPYLDLSNTAPIIEFGLTPANGEFGPFAYNGDTANSPVIDTAVALVIASPQVLNTSESITVAIDTSQISAYNNANGTNYTLLPANLYTLGSMPITIPAGYRVGRVPVTINFPSFPAGSYMYALPLKITNGGNLIISSNSSTFMWLFQQ